MKDWIKTLATVAPSIATALGGPLAGVAVKLAADALGVDDESSIEEMVLSGDPEALLALKTAEANFKVEMKKLDIDIARIDGADRASARTLAKENMLPQVIFSTIYTVGYMLVLWQFTTGDIVIPADSKVLFGTVLGVLTAAQTQILNFWFGSSHGSKLKRKEGG